MFSQCHASSSQGRGHNTGGKYDGDTQTNTRCPLYLYMSAVQTNVKTPEIRNLQEGLITSVTGALLLSGQASKDTGNKGFCL